MSYKSSARDIICISMTEHWIYS